MNSKEVIEKLKVAETTILELGLLHFAEPIDNKVLTLQEFIFKLITEWFPKYDSLNGQNVVETKADKHRSVVDIYRLTKTYFPDVTLEDVLQELCYWAYKNKFYSIYCADIHKLTFFTKGSREYGNSFPGKSYDSICKVLKILLFDITSYITKEKCMV